MSTYATTTDLTERIGVATAAQLTTDASSTVPDTAVLDQTVRAAEQTIDSYLARRYGVPVDTAANPSLADLLRSKTLVMAHYQLRVNRPPIPDDVADAYRECIRWLQDIAMGKANLPAVNELSGPTASGPVGQAEGRPRRNYYDF